MIYQQNSNQPYLTYLHNSSYLSAEEELNLFKQFNSTGNKEFIDLIVISHLRLVHKMARLYQTKTIPLADLISEGTIGLLKATQTFDINQGFRFSTYARWWIRASILDYKMHNTSLVNMCTTANKKKLYFNLVKVKNKLNLGTVKTLTPTELYNIAIELNVTVKEVQDINSRLLQTDISLNTSVNTEDESSELLDYVEARETTQDILIIESEDKIIKRKLMNQAIALLSDRERAILQARRLTERPKTLDELANEYNVSRERIRQIENRVIEKLQEYVQK